MYDCDDYASVEDEDNQQSYHVDAEDAHDQDHQPPLIIQQAPDLPCQVHCYCTDSIILDTVVVQCLVLIIVDCTLHAVHCTLYSTVHGEYWIGLIL